MANIDPPFFIVGAPRSGTTLLRFVLSSHPRLFIPSETGFLPYLASFAGQELTVNDVRLVLDQIAARNREWSSVVDEDPAVLLETLEVPTLPHLIDALYRRRIADQGAKRWGDKTPTYVRFIPEIHEIFPTAQFIHVLRDGRDATLSAMDKWGERHWYMDSYYLLTNWVDYIQQGRAAKEILGVDSYLEIHYENLVGDPLGTLETLCEFLHVEFHPAMLDHTQLARKLIVSRGHLEVRQPITTNHVQRWRTEMSSYDQKLADRIAGPTLDVLGYARYSPGPFSITERFRNAGQSIKYRTIRFLRDALTSLGFLQINRGKRKIIHPKYG